MTALFNTITVKQEFYYNLHTNWSNLQNTQQNSTKFSGMSGEDEKMIIEKNFKRDRAN